MIDVIAIGCVAGLLLVMAGAILLEGGRDGFVYAVACVIAAAPFTWMTVDDFPRRRAEPRGFEVGKANEDREYDRHD